LESGKTVLANKAIQQSEPIQHPPQKPSYGGRTQDEGNENW
jgi:hypothetical protein